MMCGLRPWDKPSVALSLRSRRHYQGESSDFFSRPYPMARAQSTRKAAPASPPKAMIAWQSTLREAGPQPSVMPSCVVVFPPAHHGFGEGQRSIHSAICGQSPYRSSNGDPVPPPCAWGLGTAARGGAGAISLRPPLAGAGRTAAGGGAGAVSPGGAVEGSAVPATCASSVVTQVPNLATDLSSTCVRLIAKRADRSRQDAEVSAAAASNPQDASPRIKQTEQALRRIAVHI